MTKKHIWAKLLIVALIVAMVSAFFIGCDDKEKGPENTPCTNHVDANGDGKCDNCGADVSTPTPPPSSDGVEALFGILDDAVAKAGGIDNIGNLGTDAYLELAMDQNETIKKVRIDLDLSLDLIPENNTGYANNGFGFTVSVDNGDGNLNRVFGIWYVDQLEAAENYVYLSAGGQNLKIDALTLASVLERYNVNANVPVGDKITDSLVSDAASEVIGMIASFVTINHETVGNNEVCSLNIRELFNPTGMLCGMIDGLFFGNETVDPVIDLGAILADMGIKMNTASILYDALPDVNITVTGNYDANKNFESIAIGLDIAGKTDGISLPSIDDGNKVLIESVPATNLSATLGYEFISGEAAWENVSGVYDAAIAGVEWNEIGVLNFAFKGQLTLGKTAEEAKTYNIELSADINAAAVADATFVKKLYYTENGVATSKDWFYLRGQGPFAGDNELDIIDTLLPAINSLYIKMVNVGDPSDILLINLDEAITFENLQFKSGKITINLKALSGILDTFGIKLPENVANMITKLNGTLGVSAFLDLVKPVLSSFVYTNVPEDATTVAPAAATAGELAMAEESEEGSDILSTIMSVIDKIKNCITVGTDSITAAGKGPDYAIGGAELDFNITASLLRNTDKAVNGINVKFNSPLKLDYNAEIKDGENVIGTDKVLTVIDVPYLQVGGTGNLFKAAVSVTQDKELTYTNPDADHENSASSFSIYVAIDLEKIGYGCATRTPVVLENGNPTSDIFTNVGWSISKADVK